MNDKYLTDFAKTMSGYLFDYLPIQIGVSENTYKSYYDTIRLFLNYCAKEHDLKRHKLKISDINRDIVIGFYDWIEAERECSPSTRNQRRAGINSFFKYVQYKKPEYILSCQQILSIPKKNESPRIIKHISFQAVQGILECADLNTKGGRKDFVFLSLIYETASRASEIAGLSFSDVIFEKNCATVHLRGKGGKERDVPLQRDPSKILRKYINEEKHYRNCNLSDPLFCNNKGEGLSRGGVYYIIKKYVKAAKEKYPEMYPESVHPHVFRHSKAMHWLEAGVDLQYIKYLLGHSDIKTTEVYASLSTEMKRKHIEKVHPQNTAMPNASWSNDADLLEWLLEFSSESSK